MQGICADNLQSFLCKEKPTIITLARRKKTFPTKGFVGKLHQGHMARQEEILAVWA